MKNSLRFYTQVVAYELFDDYRRLGLIFKHDRRILFLSGGRAQRVNRLIHLNNQNVLAQPTFLLSFDGILPTPEGFEASLGPYKPGPEPLTPVDRWRIRHWGTRGKPRTRCVRLKNHSIEVYFETVWSPPEGVYQAIKTQFPSVHIKSCCSHP